MLSFCNSLGIIQTSKAERQTLLDGWGFGETEENDCLDELSRQRQDAFALSKKMMGARVSFVSSDLGANRCPACPSRHLCCFYALVAQIMSRWTFTARKLPQYVLGTRMKGCLVPFFFFLSICSRFFSPRVNLRETLLPRFVWLALTLLKTAIRGPFWGFVAD